MSGGWGLKTIQNSSPRSNACENWTRHFIASLGFNGKEYDTTLEMMLRVSQRRLAWRTLADHRARDHFAAGVVCFAPLSDQSTCVTLKLPSSFGGAVSRRVRIYLENFKKLIEDEAARADGR